jgi:hypothetical protein
MLWVKFGGFQIDEVTTANCTSVNNFKEEIIKAFRQTDLVVRAEFGIFVEGKGSPAEPYDSLQDAFYDPNTKKWFGTSGKEPLIAKLFPVAAPPVAPLTFRVPLLPVQAERQKNVIAVGAKKIPSTVIFCYL